MSRYAGILLGPPGELKKEAGAPLEELMEEQAVLEVTMSSKGSSMLVGCFIEATSNDTIERSN